MYSLAIDCSHRENFIGLFENTDKWLLKCTLNGQPFEELIEKLKCLLVEGSINLSEISHFYSPHSPGSTLGIRVTQMMVQGFMKTACPSAKFTQYNGLHFSALLLEGKNEETNSNNYLITENGRHSWNVLKIDAHLKLRPEIQQYGSEALSNLEGNFFYIRQMKTWSNPPVNAKELEYSPDQFLGLIGMLRTLKIDTSLLLPTSNSYVKWNQNKRLK